LIIIAKNSLTHTAFNPSLLITAFIFTSSKMRMPVAIKLRPHTLVAPVAELAPARIVQAGVLLFLGIWGRLLRCCGQTRPLRMGIRGGPGLTLRLALTHISPKKGLCAGGMKRGEKTEEMTPLRSDQPLRMGIRGGPGWALRLALTHIYPKAQLPWLHWWNICWFSNSKAR